MYGPPPSPAEITIIAPWTAWLISILIGFGLTFLSRRPNFSAILRLSLLSLGICILLTAPVIGLPNEIIWGAYPTIDKKASLMFYLADAHWLPIFRPEDLTTYAPLRLIGIHIFHMWVTELFDLILSTASAINAHALTNLWLSVLFATLYIRSQVENDHWASLLGGLCFGLSLHQFRDIQWYTIEKSGIYWIPLFLWQIERVSKGGRIAYLPFIWLGSALYNLYFAIIMAGCGLLMAIMARKTRVWYAIGICFIVGCTIGGIQYWLMHTGPQLGTPEDFQNRARLDIVELWPLLWNRLEMWRVCSPLMIIGIWMTVREGLWKKKELVLAVSFALLSFGPILFGVYPNPIYEIAHRIPGLWRMAKPETYFVVTFLMFCLWTSIGIIKLKWNKYPIYLIPAFVLFWVLTTRLHPVYPHFTEYRPATLDPNWENRVFKIEPNE